jgi:hypothetical protein
MLTDEMLVVMSVDEKFGLATGKAMEITVSVDR